MFWPLCLFLNHSHLVLRIDSDSNFMQTYFNYSALWTIYFDSAFVESAFDLLLIQSKFKSTELQTHTYCSAISKSREKTKPDHHRFSTEHKHILKGLSDSGSPHYWSYAAQVFPSLVNSSCSEWLNVSTQHTRAASHPRLGTPGCTLLQTGWDKPSPTH